MMTDPTAEDLAWQADIDRLRAAVGLPRPKDIDRRLRGDDESTRRATNDDG